MGTGSNIAPSNSSLIKKQFWIDIQAAAASVRAEDAVVSLASSNFFGGHNELGSSYFRRGCYADLIFKCNSIFASANIYHCRRICIFGTPGIGKSTFLADLLLHQLVFKKKHKFFVYATRDVSQLNGMMVTRFEVGSGAVLCSNFYEAVLNDPAVHLSEVLVLIDTAPFLSTEYACDVVIVASAGSCSQYKK